jgi:hypothetical protein
MGGGGKKGQLTPSPQKGPKKALRYFFIAFELGIVYCSPGKAIKTYHLVYFGPFWGEGVK